MLFVGIVIVLVAAAMMPRIRVPRGVDANHLGSMSERWLAEHRATHAAH